MLIVVVVEGGTPSVLSSHEDALQAYHAWHDFVVATVAPEEVSAWDATCAVGDRLGASWSDEAWSSLDRGEDATLYVTDDLVVSVLHVV